MVDWDRIGWLTNHYDHYIKKFETFSQKKIYEEISQIESEIKSIKAIFPDNPGKIQLEKLHDHLTDLVKTKNGEVLSESQDNILKSIEFYKAVEDGDITLVQELINENVDVDYKHESGYNPLTIAIDCAYSSEEMISLLIEKGADVNGAKSSYSPLHLAVDAGEYDIMELLIRAGVDVNKKKPSDVEYPLHTLARGCLEPYFFELMINAGAKVNVKNDDNETPLDIVLENIDQNKKYLNEIKNIVEILIEAGVDVTICNNSGYSTLDSFVNEYENIPNIKYPQIEEIHTILVESLKSSPITNKGSIISRLIFWRK